MRSSSGRAHQANTLAAQDDYEDEDEDEDEPEKIKRAEVCVTVTCPTGREVKAFYLPETIKV